ncbi:MAG: hypothetical protein K9G67_04205 [Bacteroidales bacterium]|nr:hypothetical protein [Bacteroidales bacterium]MCF8343300.1 hypothetical protein [Bacteroidales bacterium]MCF8349870.1 hypothetical protein [Bacteroidales bacterium]MCF8375534.1 hypothetical protein [Bacteroidales bacterium]MCF8399933.1 hypothetical protein [Bacteroidales bacterium]
MKHNMIITSIIFSLILLFNTTASSQEGYSYTDPTQQFRIEFPGEPETDRSTVPTEVGDIIMHTVMYEESLDKVYLLAYSDYPKELIELSDPVVLLESAQQGSMSNLGTNELNLNEEIVFEGFPGLYYEAQSEDLYVAYKIILVENRLYQMAILQQGMPLDEADVKSFMDSFKLFKTVSFD